MLLRPKAEPVEGIQYNGTNVAQINEFLEGKATVIQTSYGLIIHGGRGPWTMYIGDWIVRTGSNFSTVLSETFPTRYDIIEEGDEHGV